MNCSDRERYECKKNKSYKLRWSKKFIFTQICTKIDEGALLTSLNIYGHHLGRFSADYHLKFKGSNIFHCMTTYETAVSEEQFF